MGCQKLGIVLVNQVSKNTFLNWNIWQWKLTFIVGFRHFLLTHGYGAKLKDCKGDKNVDKSYFVGTLESQIKT